MNIKNEIRTVDDFVEQTISICDRYNDIYLSSRQKINRSHLLYTNDDIEYIVDRLKQGYSFNFFDQMMFENYKSINSDDLSFFNNYPKFEYLIK